MAKPSREELFAYVKGRGRPVSPQVSPYVVNVEEGGAYVWCACGLSATQPWCDGSHEGTSFLPIEFTITEKKQVALCNCQRTQDGPYCDGSHENI